MTTSHASSHASFVGSIPEKYDQYLGPLLFEHFATDLARRISVPAGGVVLETACGTGIATRRLRTELSDDVRIDATDLQDPMLDFARDKCGDLANVTFRQADAEDLPFDDDVYDAVVNQFGMMFAEDKPSAVEAAHRVLKPGGTFAFNVWDSMDHNTFARLVHETAATFFASDPPTFMETPFGSYEQDPWRTMIDRAGFTNVTFDVVPHMSTPSSAQTVATGFIEGNPMIGDIRDRATAPVEAVIERLAAALREAFGDDPMRVPLQAIVVTATK